jgi:hypothetical protein
MQSTTPEGTMAHPRCSFRIVIDTFPKIREVNVQEGVLKIGVRTSPKMFTLEYQGTARITWRIIRKESKAISDLGLAD